MLKVWKMYPGNNQRISRKRVALPLVTAAILSFLGIALIIAATIRTLIPHYKSKVTIQMTLVGTGNRPIKDAEIWVTRPEVKLLGTTDVLGKGVFTTELPKGKLAVLEARGATFTVTRDVPIPNLPEYGVSFMMSPAEAEAGRIKIESITRDQRENRALGEYANAIAAKRADQVAAAIGQIQVTLAPSNEQADLNAAELAFMTKVKAAFERTAKSIRYSLLSKGANIINLRLVRSEKLYLEMRIYNANEVLVGGRIEETAKLRPQTLAKLLAEALEGRAGNTNPEQNNPARQQERKYHLSIRKRPVDNLLVYINGKIMDSTVENEQLIAWLPGPFAPNKKWQVAATGNSGLIVTKDLDGRALNRNPAWQWPEWLMSQRTETERTR
jgi:hypothetical protein